MGKLLNQDNLTFNIHKYLFSSPMGKLLNGKDMLALQFEVCFVPYGEIVKPGFER